VAECPESHHFSKTAFGSMSLNNNNPVNNEGQGSSNGSGNRAEHKGRYKGFGFLRARSMRSQERPAVRPSGHRRGQPAVEL
jgi:hypothetical protein